MKTIMADFNLWGTQQTLSQALHGNVAFLVSPHQTFLKTTEHSATNTILSRGSRRKLFNSSLMNKLIRIEWVSAIRLPSNLMDVTHPWAKRTLQHVAENDKNSTTKSVYSNMLKKSSNLQTPGAKFLYMVLLIKVFTKYTNHLSR